MTYSQGRRGRPWRRLCDEVYRTERICHLCGNEVDKTLPWRHPLSKSVDHVRSLIDYPHLALDRSNVRLSHRRCNLSKGAGRSTRSKLLPLGRRSRAW